MKQASSPGVGAFMALKERALLCMQYARIKAGYADGPAEVSDLPPERGVLTVGETQVADQILAAIVQRYNRETGSNISGYSLADYERKIPISESEYWPRMIKDCNRIVMWCDQSITMVSGLEVVPSTASVNYWSISGNNHVISAGDNDGQIVRQSGDSSTAQFNSGAMGTLTTKNSASPNAEDLYHLLKLLLSAMQREAKTSEETAATAAVAEAAREAEDGNVEGALTRLKTAGKWAVDVGEKIGIGLAVAAIKSAMGL
ncbi:hypothetical protein ACIQUG_32230 [Ensifer sp. NPDC090286]|uniref:hypothetical protein n=1 Tax=Ensifer sp. NPDC090286 TaxID=3363991 RepID=UPI00383A68A5